MSPHLFRIRLFSSLVLFNSVWALAEENPNTQLKQHIYSAQLSAKYLTFPGLKSNRWESGVIEWWYNPNSQPYSTEIILQAIQYATQAWESIANIQFEYKGITHQALNNEQDNKLIIGWLASSEFENRFGYFAAYAHIWWDGSFIHEGEISLNNGYFVPTAQSKLQGIITHELGHILGLDHSDQPTSIMYSPYHSAKYQETLRLDDIIAASNLYPITINLNLQKFVNCNVIVTRDMDLYFPVVKIDSNPPAFVSAYLTYKGIDTSNHPIWTLTESQSIHDVDNLLMLFNLECRNTFNHSNWQIDVETARQDHPNGNHIFSGNLSYLGINSQGQHHWTLSK